MTGTPGDRPRPAVLYTPELLALAVSLAEVPLDPALSRRGEARSRTCGSTVAVSLATDDFGRIARLGVRASACAVGQAAAALFARGAAGRDEAGIAAARDSIAAWLAGSQQEPDWPGIAALAPARAHPARHGAIILAWEAALGALSKVETGG